MKEEILKMVKGMSGDMLKEFHEAASDEAERRRPKATLDMIRPGMTKEEIALVRGEIARVIQGDR